MHCFFFAFLLFASPAPPQHPLPPPGITLAPKDEHALRSELDRLTQRLNSLRENPYAPDVIIFEKAVRYALDGNEFFAQEDVFRAKELLRIGLERAEALAKGDAPWSRATGLSVRGYMSQIDHSVQPYGLVVPPSYAADRPHKWRVDAWFHGRSETLSEINFLWDRLHNAGQFTPPDTIVLHLYGRYCNASTFAGEVDFFEALDNVKSRFSVDENRILVRGFSMGGASAWHIGAHYGTDFAAVAPGAGFAETAEFYGYAKKAYQPTWFQEKLLHLTNATDYALNFFSVPVVAYNGDHDAQRQAADIMEKNLASEGLTLSRVWGQNIGHAYTPDAIVQINKSMDALAARGRDERPRRIRFTTWTLKYNRMRWVAVDGMEKHWDRARVNADIEGDHTVRVATANISALSFHMGSGDGLLDPASKVTVLLDGQSLVAPGPLTDGSWVARFRKAGTRWMLSTEEEAGLRKQHNLQGPIDDAFMSSFLLVRPTGTSANDTVETWVKSEQERAVHEWRKQFRGDAQVKDDTQITDADIAANNLILWGDPQSNKVLARIADKLPIRWTQDSVTLGNRRFPAASHALVMIYPNPLNPAKYVVLNSGFTFRESAYSNNSLQIAMLPDYAVVDISTPPDAQWPGKIAAAGFFGEKWDLQAGDGK
jgi:pimeloyl-ACP methyl ester carboxylesterase